MIHLLKKSHLKDILNLYKTYKKTKVFQTNIKRVSNNIIYNIFLMVIKGIFYK